MFVIWRRSKNEIRDRLVKRSIAWMLACYVLSRKNLSFVRVDHLEFIRDRNKNMQTPFRSLAISTGQRVPESAGSISRWRLREPANHLRRQFLRVKR